MKITDITYARGQTINTQSFNSGRVDVSVTARLDDGEEPEAVYAKLRDTVNSKVAVEAAKHGAR